MKNFIELIVAASAFASISAFAQEDIKANTPNSGYVQDTRGVIARDAYGLCWRTGYWTPADAVGGCDGEIAKPVQKAAATPVAAPAVAVPAPAVVPVVKAAPTAEKVTFAADAFFDFDKSVLKTDGKTKLDDMADKLKNVDIEAVIAVGHTDSVGTDSYNQKLSIRRAEAVKAYLVSKGVDHKRVFTEGKGEKAPIADNKTAEGRAKNRRVEIEVVGNRNK